MKLTEHTCVICGAVYYNTPKQKRMTCSPRCRAKLTANNNKSKTGMKYKSKGIVKKDNQRHYQTVFRPTNCQYCPLGIKYDKDENGEYVCGRMETERQSSGMMYVKRPDRRCKIGKA